MAAEITPQTIQGLPSISSVQVVVDPGPAMAAVQPTAHLRFKLSSCSQFTFSEPEVTEEGEVLFVKVVVNPLQRECHGPTSSREYEVQISSDFAPRTKVVVLNPVDDGRHI